MRELLIILGFANPEPAYADNAEPPRVVHIDFIEVNICERGTTLNQVVFWRIDYDKHDRRFTTIDCGWKNWSQVAFIQHEDGYAVICERENTVWIAPVAYWSHTDFDPEMVYRDLRW